MLSFHELGWCLVAWRRVEVRVDEGLERRRGERLLARIAWTQTE
jgi:hypothetical protein